MSVLQEDEYSSINEFVRCTLNDQSNMIVFSFDEFESDVVAAVKSKQISQIRNMLDITSKTESVFNIFTTNLWLEPDSDNFKTWDSQYFIKRFDLIIGFHVTGEDNDISFSRENIEISVYDPKNEKILV